MKVDYKYLSDNVMQLIPEDYYTFQQLLAHIEILGVKAVQMRNSIFIPTDNDEEVISFEKFKFNQLL